MGGCRLLYFVKSKSGTKCKNFATLLCFYVNTFILLYFLRWQKGGGYSPPKSATDMYIYIYICVCVCAYVIIKFQSTCMQHV